MAVKKTVLIAEDAFVNRKVLVKLLSEEYVLLEAENGRDALELLHQHGTSIAAVILDLVMPVMDGFDFLRAIQGQEEFRNLPIIVATGNVGEESEVDALRLGAWDFITKPYNGEIIRFRLRNAIERSQLSAFNQLKYLAEFDALTGIYNKSKFFLATREMLDAFPDQQFAFLRIDIDRFQLVNSFFGADEGDRLLCYLANSLKRADGEHYTYGRIEADVFAACFTYPSREKVLQALEFSKERIRNYNRNFDIVPVFGVYFLDDLSLSVSDMLDRAALAAKTRKGGYLDTTALYVPEMSRRLEKEQEIINDMTAALRDGQFCVYLQPKYSLLTNLPAGAEALVRWRHPVKGMIAPGEFVPVFEKNGFIAKLDFFVWESVCALLRRWLDDGVSPAPISVNVSRVNLYNPNLAHLFSVLIEKYRVPSQLLQLEVTESAYMDNPQLMEQTVSQLHAAGFSILMDDFGSGYSSLSMLKDIDVDVLKIDMRFFEKTHDSGRGENIVASVIRMAKWLTVPVTAEGVETQDQVDFLRSVGCDFVQGFFFARPMPPEEYARLIRKDAADVPAPPAERYRGLNPDRLWSLDPEMLLLFADDPLARAFYEFDGQSLEILRVNKAFNTLCGFTDLTLDMDPLRSIVPEHHQLVMDTCRACLESHAVQICEYRRVTPDGRLLWIRFRVQYVQPVGTRHILMGHLLDITPMKTLEQKYHQAVTAAPALRKFELERMFSLPDIRELLAFLKEIFDVARLVDPIHTAVVEPREDGSLELLPYTCFRVWGRETRCDDCTSICAMRSDCKMTKYEYIKNDIFYVVSNPISIRDGNGEERRLALELVSHVSDHLTLHRPGEKSIEELIEETQRKIYTDELTGAYNRRYLSELLFSHHHQWGVATRLGLVLLDLQNFKRINDRYGHAEGDRVLLETAAKLRESVRQNDSVIRYGGDEFVITLTDCTEAQVRAAIERMRAAIGTIRFGAAGEYTAQADCGYSYTPHFDAQREQMETMLHTADEAMYAEKRRHADPLVPPSQDFE